MQRLIAVIATERTGTNYFCNLMEKSLDINGMYEIFHPEAPFGLGDILISKALKMDFKTISGMDNQKKAVLVRGNAIQILEGLILYEKKKSLFKIFPSHLETDVVKKEIIENRNILKVIIDRSPLDVYISQQKAGLISKWGNVDTTGIKISLSRSKFEIWYKNRRSWYEFCVSAMEDSCQAYAVMHYTDIESRTPEELVDFFVELTARHGCMLTKSASKLTGLMEKQDKNIEPRYKVDNWKQFKNSFSKGKVPCQYFQGFLGHRSG